MIHYYDANKFEYNSDGKWIHIDLDKIKKATGKTNINDVKIANIIVSKDVRPRQSLYIVLWLNYESKIESEKETRIFVYKQVESKSEHELQVGSFDLWIGHSLNGLRIKDNS